jgi:hypothetical protein
MGSIIDRKLSKKIKIIIPHYFMINTLIYYMRFVCKYLIIY